MSDHTNDHPTPGDTNHDATEQEPNAPRENDDRTEPLGVPSAPEGDEHPLGQDDGATDRTSDRLGGGHE